MANSDLYFYKIPLLSESANFAIDDPEYFFTNEAVANYTFNDFQYQKVEATKRVKLAFSQQAAVNGSLFRKAANYARIRTNGKDAYYFITGVRQLAGMTIDVSLKLDVLTTFFSAWSGALNEKTVRTRGHFDRYSGIRKQISQLLPTVNILTPIFSRTKEIENPQLYRKEVSKIEDSKLRSEAAGLYFYIIYRTAEDGRPCIDLCASKDLKIGNSSSGPAYRLTIDDLVEGQSYYATGDFNIIVFDGSGPRTYQGTGGLFRVRKSAGRFIFGVMYSGGADEYNFGVTSNQYVEIQRGKYLYISGIWTADPNEIVNFDRQTINAGTFSEEVIPALSPALDVTSDRLVKVIECPYPPVPVTYSPLTGLFSFDSPLFTTKSPEGFLRTYEVGKVSFENTSIDVREVWRLNPFADGYFNQPRTRGSLLDPKIKTSPFYQPTYVYDSFSQIVKLEDYIANSNASQNTGAPLRVKVDYKQSSTLSSSLIFKVEPADFVSFSQFVPTENYPHVLAASRNNEIPLYSSSYINYLRNGYNYDKKKLTESTAINATSTLLQFAAGIASLLAAPATGGLSAAGAIGLLTSGAITGINTVHSAKSAGEDLDQKIKLLKAQSFSVSTLDDISLFKSYSDNRLFFVVYECSDEVKNYLDDLFYYCGYACEIVGKPNLENRLYFDFVSCAPEWDIQGIANFADYADEISDRLKAGVTVLHVEEIYSDGIDLNSVFEYENIERSIRNLGGN